jgi:hypothetical protein
VRVIDAAGQSRHVDVRPELPVGQLADAIGAADGLAPGTCGLFSRGRRLCSSHTLARSGVGSANVLRLVTTVRG